MSDKHSWVPENFLYSDKVKNARNFAVIVLNRPINLDKDLVECLWNHATITITVDGGTNRWLNWIRENEKEDTLKHPDLITGDMDSCRKESVAYFNESKLIPTPEQDETDFTKSVGVLEPSINELGLEFIVALCETSGRMDQILANINTLFKIQNKPQEISRPVFILSANSITWLLAPGQHHIRIPEKVKKLWCALIPFESTTVSTSGLKWNLTNDILKFGGMVSTSNTYDSSSETVKINTDCPLLWSMGVSKLDDE